MAGEFLTGLQVGANIGNMRAMRLERMMQLKAQEAKQAIEERFMVAKINALSFEMEKKKKIDEDIGKANEMFHLLSNTTDKDPKMIMDAVDTTLLQNNPDAYKEVMGARLEGEKIKSEQARANYYNKRADAALQQDGQFQGQVYQPIDQATGLPAVDPDTGKPIKMVTTSKGGSTLLDAKTKPGELGVVGKEEIKSIYKEIDRLKEQYDTMDDTTGIGYFKKPNEKKLNLKTKIDALKQEAKSLEAASPKSSERPDQFVVGKLYEDANGNKARYRGNGQWEEVK